MSSLLLVVFVAVVTYDAVWCKVFERCELVHELSKEKYRIPLKDIATWVCIARHESEYNTSAVGHVNVDSGDHGLFQISDMYWCSPPGVGVACNLECDKLEDDDLTDDVICAHKIHREHRRRTGDGFTAWTVYRRYCRGDVSKYVRDCDSATTSTDGSHQQAEPKEHPRKDIEGDSSFSIVMPQTFPPKDVMSNFESTASPILTSTSSNEYKGRYSYLKSKPVIERKKKYKNLILENVPAKSVTFVSAKTSAKEMPTSRAHPRSSQTGFLRPASRSSDLDPKTAWFNIHYDPRFLDEFS